MQYSLTLVSIYFFKFLISLVTLNIVKKWDKVLKTCAVHFTDLRLEQEHFYVFYQKNFLINQIKQKLR